MLEHAAHDGSRRVATWQRKNPWELIALYPGHPCRNDFADLPVRDRSMPDKDKLWRVHPSQFSGQFSGFFLNAKAVQHSGCQRKIAGIIGNVLQRLERIEARIELLQLETAAALAPMLHEFARGFRQVITLTSGTSNTRCDDPQLQFTPAC
ncbi:MAG TPA: hypothetical protein VN630_06750 [Rhodanobacteraceae bacterium]|nr:hypothetical protein [Rhodanobacteraceae bacterium]